VGEVVTVRGWVRTVRAQKTFAFIEVRSARARAARTRGARSTLLLRPGS
jgi:aspartyl/asparaginyl-tRNA synthetase